MKYAVLSDENRVIDILIINPSELYEKARYISVSDETEVSLGMIYDEKMTHFTSISNLHPNPRKLIVSKLISTILYY